jgi:hypothetical protein
MIYTAGCWMWGNKANSKEHRYKKTDLKREFPLKSKGAPYSYEELPCLISFAKDAEDALTIIKGPNADCIKYPWLICADCNNKHSQKMDIAYDKFSNWCDQNPRAVYCNLKNIWGEDYINQLSNLYAYFLKVLGCEILNAGFLLPPDFPNPLDYKLENSMLRISICKSPSWNVFFPHISTRCHPSLGKGTLFGNIDISKLEIKTIVELAWSRQIGNYQINFWYNTQPLSILGKPLNGSLPVYVIPDPKLDYLDMEYVFEASINKTPYLEWLIANENMYTQYKLGIRYARGEGAEKDISKAEYWLRLAADKEYAPAQTDLGLLYYSGGERQKYIETIFQLWKSAANEGYASAQNNLGVLFKKGEGVPQDYVEAVKWFNLSARQGHIEAQYNLGNMYAFGQGIAKNEINANILWKLAANKGHALAQHNIIWSTSI